MPSFIKTGNWESKSKGSKKELNLDLLVSTLSPKVNLTAGANVLITGTYPNLTIASSGGGGGGSVWGLITGVVTDQTDLTTYLSTNYTPLSRTLSINGTSFDLSSNRSWSVGTVTTYSAGSLSPLFATNVANPTTAPALTFTLSNSAAHTWFGNNTSGSTTPSYNTAGDITEDISSILTITGSKSVLSDTSIQVKKSSVSQDGYLSSTDWSTFNSKLSPSLASGNLLIGNGGGVATSQALSGDASLLNTGALTLNTVNSTLGTFGAITINAKGLATAGSNLSGDITSSGAVTTLATVNGNVGTFGSATKSVTATVNGKGLITAISEQTLTPAIGSITGLGTGVTTFLATPSSANLASVITDETGSGALVFATSPTLVTPALGTPSSVTLTNAIGLPPTSGIIGWPANSSGVLTNNGSGTLSWTAVSAGLTIGTTSITSGTNTRILYDNSGTLGEYSISGSGNVAMTTSPSFTTPTLGVASGTSLALSSFLNEAKGADIASASTTDIGAATGTYLDVTGTVTITALGTVQAGTRRIVRFTDALILTYNATSLILPGAASITTVAGDVAEFVSLGSGNWQCTNYSSAISLNYPLTNVGDIFIGGTVTNGVATPTRLAVGSSGQVLSSDGTNPTYINNTAGWTPLWVSGSDATTTGQSLVDITGLTSGTLANSTKYEIEVVLFITTSAVTTGQQFGIGAGGTGSAAIVEVLVTGTSTDVGQTGETIKASATASTNSYNTTASASGVIYMRGFVTTRSTGTATISIQHLKTTSGTSTVKTTSRFSFKIAGT